MIKSQRWMKYLLALLVVLNIADAVLTHYLITLGLAIESNVLLAPLVGEKVFFVFKVAGPLFAALILWDIYRRYPRLALGLTTSSVVAYAIIVLWNLSLFPGLSFIL